MPPMFLLRVEPAVGEPFSHLMEEESLVIGRASESDLVVADRFLSRKHARLFVDEGRLFVEDLGSRNGTLLNDQAVEGSAEARPGDHVKVSGSVIHIEQEAESGGDTSWLDSPIKRGSLSTRKTRNNRSTRITSSDWMPGNSRLNSDGAMARKSIRP